MSSKQVEREETARTSSGAAAQLLFNDLCHRLVRRITDAVDMTDSENHDIELALARIIGQRNNVQAHLEASQQENERFAPIVAEMRRQDEKWGAGRTHPDEWWYAIMGEEFGEVGQAMLEAHFDYPDIEPNALEKELVQLLAVGHQWLAALEEGEAQDE